MKVEVELCWLFEIATEKMCQTDKSQQSQVQGLIFDSDVVVL